MTGSNLKIRFIFIVAMVAIAFSACELENVNYSDIPYIEFKELKVEDSLDIFGNTYFHIHFYLIDGDGDIGPIYNPDFIGNCNLELFYLKDGIYQKDTTILDTMQWPTIPYVGDLGQDKALKADIYIDYGPFSKYQLSFEKFFFTVTVFDMSLHKSNTISTDTIIMK